MAEAEHHIEENLAMVDERGRHIEDCVITCRSVLEHLDAALSTLARTQCGGRHRWAAVNRIDEARAHIQNSMTCGDAGASSTVRCLA